MARRYLISRGAICSCLKTPCERTRPSRVCRQAIHGLQTQTFAPATTWRMDKHQEAEKRLDDKRRRTREGCMIVTSRDYNPWQLLDHRFTQYRCPACGCYCVSVKSTARIVDGSSNAVIGSGTMICNECVHIGKGFNFQVSTHACKEGYEFGSMLADTMRETGDGWLDLRERSDVE